MQAVRWKIGDQVIDLSQRGMIMGVLNVTPDSFSDGGEFFSPDKALLRAQQMIAEGAQIIDVGGESTRPGSEPVSAGEEIRRALPIIQQLPGNIEAFVSIDTSKSEVAEAAISAGARIVNDVTGGRGDQRMLSLVAEKKAALVIMHMQGEPRTMQIAPKYDDVVEEVAIFFRQQYERALECGVDPMAIAFDPGIGFGKALEHNLALLRNLEWLQLADRPIVVGGSRKGFLGKITGRGDAHERLASTVALTALLRTRGARVFRVHDVKENVDALRIAEGLLEH